MEQFLRIEGTYWIIAIGAIGFLVRSITKLILDKNLETHKVLLQKTTIDHQILFSKLLVDRGEVLKNLYSKISTMERAMKDLVGYTTKEKADEAIKIILDLKHYFEDNKIFFDEKLASEIKKLVTTAHNAYFDANWNSEYQIVDIPNENIQNETMEKRLDGFKKVNKVLPDLKKNIENEFRTLLGVRDNIA